MRRGGVCVGSWFLVFVVEHFVAHVDRRVFRWKFSLDLGKEAVKRQADCRWHRITSCRICASGLGRRYLMCFLPTNPDGLQPRLKVVFEHTSKHSVLASLVLRHSNSLWLMSNRRPKRSIWQILCCSGPTQSTKYRPSLSPSSQQDEVIISDAESSLAPSRRRSQSTYDPPLNNVKYLHDKQIQRLRKKDNRGPFDFPEQELSDVSHSSSETGQNTNKPTITIKPIPLVTKPVGPHKPELDRSPLTRKRGEVPENKKKRKKADQGKYKNEKMKMSSPDSKDGSKQKSTLSKFKISVEVCHFILRYAFFFSLFAAVLSSQVLSLFFHL